MGSGDLFVANLQENAEKKLWAVSY